MRRRERSILGVAFSLLGCTVVTADLPAEAACVLPLTTPDPNLPLRDFLRYNFVQQKSSHNSYDKDLSLVEQLRLGVRSVELDIHLTKGRDEPLNNDWFVFHINAPLLRDTSCESLSVCLSELLSFHQERPKHEIITVLVDLKDDFDETHSPEVLDQVILGAIPEELIFTPGELLANCEGATDVRSSVQGECGWPTLQQLTGKFMFVVTGGGLTAGSKMSVYLGEDAAQRLIFAGPDIERGDSVEGSPDAVFYNLNINESFLMPEVLAQGFAGRIWKTNEPGYWARAKGSCANHIATDELDLEASPWATTQNQAGWPFSCFSSLGVDCSGLFEEYP